MQKGALPSKNCLKSQISAHQEVLLTHGFFLWRPYDPARPIEWQATKQGLSPSHLTVSSPYTSIAWSHGCCICSQPAHTRWSTQSPTVTCVLPGCGTVSEWHSWLRLPLSSSVTIWSLSQGALGRHFPRSFLSLTSPQQCCGHSYCWVCVCPCQAGLGNL